MSKEKFSVFEWTIFTIGITVLGFMALFHSKIGDKEKRSMGPWKKSVTLNSMGFRDLEHSLKKKRGTFRIVILGDSMTYGTFIYEQENIYPRRLENLLNQNLKEPRFEVFNFSKPGWGTGDEFSALLKHGLKYEPDLAFVGYWPNDIPILKGIPPELCRNPLDHFFETRLKSLYKILKESSLFNFLFNKWNNFGAVIGLASNHSTIYGECLNNLFKSRGWELQKIYFDLLDFTARRKNFHLIIGILPFISTSLGEDYPLLQGNETIKSFLKARGIQYIDLYKSGFKGKNPKKLSADFPDPHFNSSAADLVARIIYDKLKVIKDRFADDSFALNYSKDEVTDILRPKLGSTKGKGNPLLQFKTLNWPQGDHIQKSFTKTPVSVFKPNFDNRLVVGDPLYFERSWIPNLSIKTGPKAEQDFYDALRFFYLWKDYFDSLVATALSDKPSLAFLRALKKVYEEKNEKEQLDLLKAKFNF